jgi:hypothetical protein
LFRFQEAIQSGVIFAGHRHNLWNPDWLLRWSSLLYPLPFFIKHSLFVSSLIFFFLFFLSFSFAALVISAIYLSGPFDMKWYIAAAWGLGLAFFYLLLSLGRLVAVF